MEVCGVSVSGITFGGGREERPGVGRVHADFFLPECSPGVCVGSFGNSWA